MWRRAGRGRAAAHTGRRPPAGRRLFLDRTHFSAEKTQGARAIAGMFFAASKVAGAGVLLVCAPSSANARVPPAPQDAATPKFSTKKLVVVRPLLKKVVRFRFPASLSGAPTWEEIFRENFYSRFFFLNSFPLTRFRVGLRIFATQGKFGWRKKTFFFWDL